GPPCARAPRAQPRWRGRPDDGYNMGIRSRAWIAVLVVVLWGASGCMEGPRCGQYPLTPKVRQCMIDTVDEMVHLHYPFADQKGIDLAAFSQQLRAIPQSSEELDDAGFLLELARAIALLRDGHTRIERHYLEQPAT